MKKFYLLLVNLFLISCLFAQDKTYLIDFGPNDMANGNITSSPDANGNYWNNVIDPTTNGPAINLVDKQNSTSDIEVSIVDDLASNGIQNGGLLMPDESLLGEFAINTATQDYFFTTSLGIIAFDNLDPSKGYVFNIFASRNTPNARWSKYTFTGFNQVVDSLQSSGTDIGGTGYNGNNSTILTTIPIKPDASGRITISTTVLTGGFAYINTMQVNEVDPNPQYFVDFGPNDITNGNITLSPDINGNYWNNMTMSDNQNDSLFLVEKNSSLSNVYIKVTDNFAMNGIQNGGLLMPEAALLDDFAIPTATQDYFFTTSMGSLEIGQLDTTSKFVFSLFGSRNSDQTRITNYTLNGDNSYSGTLQTSGAGIGAGGYNGNNNTVLVTDTIYPNSNGKIVLDLAVETGGFAYLGFMKMEEIIAPPGPICPEQDSLHISVMGSSVALGVGANNNQGYAYNYTQLLDQRAADGIGADWEVTNISIGGNNTIDVLNRWETDLQPLCGRYVIYGLSLGNEGITTQGQAAFDQFRDNMLILIDRARDEGIEPIVMNNYTRNDFNAINYDYIKQMNLLIHSWDVASVNTLGAVDEGTGKWAPGYFADGGHPNDQGHLEFYYAMVPSLFDALKEGKPQPEKVTGTYLTIDKSVSEYQLEFTPDEVVHPFTFSFDVRTSLTGSIAGFTTDDNGYGGLIIEPSGVLNYVNSNGDIISGVTTINDNNWHNITLTHYYAWGKTFLYVDGIIQGEVDEKLEADKFILSEQDAPTADYREWLFYRSAMNQQEINAIVTGELLKSSLELYAPLDGQGVIGLDTLLNLAQSLNEVKQVDDSDYITSINEINLEYLTSFKVYPNPTSNLTNIQFQLKDRSDVQLSIYNSLGQQVEVLIDDSLPSSDYHFSWDKGENVSGVYFCSLKINGKNFIKKLELID